MRPDGAATAALGPGRRANAMAAVDNDVVPQLSPSDRVKLLELAYNDRNALAEALRHLGFTKLGPRKRVELELLRKCHNRAPPPISLASGSSATAALADACANSADRPGEADAGEASAVSSAITSMIVRGPGFKGVRARGVGRLALDLHYEGLIQIQHEPPVFVCQNFLSPDECAELISHALPLLLPSETESGITTQRTSWTTHLDWSAPCCAGMQAKAERLTQLPSHRFEALQVARYTRGQYYQPHLDSNEDWDAELGARQGPRISRIATILTYLNDVPSGGGTRFPYLGLEVRPRQGCALIFFPSLLSGSVDHLTLHEALPAEETKFVSQLWVQ